MAPHVHVPSSTRKPPQQERSRLMVERILEAARAVLLEDGHDAASTNRIARRAGISPGSLYQYFASKEAVVTAVVERYAGEVSARVTAALTDHLHTDDLVRSSLTALVKALEDDAPLLRLVVEHLPPAQNRSRLEALEQRITEVVTAYLSARRGTMRDVRPAVAAWILVQTIEQLTVRYVLDRPDITREQFVSETARLVAGYLGGGKPDARE